MIERRKLIFLISNLSILLSIAAVLLQLHVILFIKIQEQQRQKSTLWQEAIMSRNSELTFYRRMKQVLTLLNKCFYFSLWFLPMSKVVITYI